MWWRSGKKREKDLQDEIADHMASEAEALQKSGVPMHSAKDAAKRQFGPVALIEEECRDTRRWPTLEDTARDFRYAARALRKSPWFTLTAVGSLALGIGLTTALFSIVDAVLLRPLALPEPDRLVWLEEIRDGSPSGGNPARLRDWGTAQSFQGVLGIYSEGLILTGGSSPDRVLAVRTFGSVLPVLGWQPRLGRSFTPDEEAGGGAPVAMISGRLWRSRFQGSTGVLTERLATADGVYQIIGVLDQEQMYPGDVDIWAPAPRAVQEASRAAGFLGQVARLKPGVTLQEAQAEMTAIASRLGRDYPETDQRLMVKLQSFKEHEVREAKAPLLVLFGTTAAVMLVACLNLAGLLLARGFAREREASIRMALGSSRARLLRLFLAEAMLLSFAGAALGMLLATEAIRLLQRLLPSDIPSLQAASLDTRVVLFALGAAVVCGLTAGFTPAWQFAGTASATRLKEGGAGSVGKSRQGLRSLLVVTEVAGSVMLLAAAALLVRSLIVQTGEPLGFNPRHAVTFTSSFGWDTDKTKLDAYARSMLEGLRAIPGVQAAGVTDQLPLGGGSQSGAIHVRGTQLDAGTALRQAGWRTASPEFFAAAGIPLQSGSLFDRPGSKTALTNETFVRLYLKGQSPIGRFVARRERDKLPDEKTRWYRVTGVLKDVRVRPDQKDPWPEVYVPWGDEYWPMMQFVVRSGQDVGELRASLREIGARSDPNQILGDVRAMEAYVASATQAPRFRTALLSGFASLALLVAALGLYGLLAAETRARSQEFGVRAALGASRSQLLITAMRRGLILAGVGVAIGIGGSLITNRLLTTLLYGVSPYDPPSLASASAMLLLAGVAATYLPARRAARIDPSSALRHE